MKPRQKYHQGHPGMHPLTVDVGGHRRRVVQALLSTKVRMEISDRAAVDWGKRTQEELRAAAARKPVVIQPIGATEQHGYHLPLNTDNFIVTRLCDAAGRRAPDEMLVLPVIPFAFNAHHMDFPGVVAIKWDHVINYLIDVVESVTTHGFDGFIVISGH